jgi:hypothetical protein
MASSLPKSPLVPLVAALLMAACDGAGNNPAVSEATGSAAAIEPSTTAPRTVEVPSFLPSPEPVTTETPMAEPPTASVAVEGGDPVVGQLGTFTWENGGSDAPWLDGSPIHVGAGERLFMTLAEPVALDEWSVSRVPPGNRDGIGAVSMDEGPGGVVTFQAPPIGNWSVGVRVRFAGKLGTALYYWLIEVD